ncbi:MAG: hypothetical protein ACYC3I_17180 [Gemmataceae bacterium]
MSFKSRLNQIEKSLPDDGESCPACQFLLWIEARRLPSGELVQRDGAPLPPVCSCRSSAVKQFVVVCGLAPLAPETD